MRASAKMDIGALKADQLGHTQTCLRSKPKQRIVTPSGPSRPLGDGKQCVQFWFSQERNESSVEALGRNGEHTLDYAGVLGMAKRGVAEQRADRSQSSITGAHSILPLVLEVVEEGANQWGVEVVDLQLRGLRAAQRRRKNQH
jgi:hypothetical protein